MTSVTQNGARLQDALHLLRDPKPDPRGGVWAFCPCHTDGTKRRRRSLHVTERDNKLLFHCFAGCKYEDIVTALGLKRGRGRKEEPDATYQYVDEGGKLLFEVCRFPGKRFVQRRPDGTGGWVWKLGDTRRVLYRLPEVLQAAKHGDTVFLVEGEKDADRLRSLGLAATCNPGGAGKWRQEYAETLRGANVVILPDNDEPGRKHANQVAQSLRSAAASVKVLELPDLPEKGDVSAWLAGGGTKDELLRLAARCAEWEPARERAALMAAIETEKPGSGLLGLACYQPWLEALSKTPYRADYNGNLCYVRYTEKGGEQKVTIANFLARPVREVTRDNGADREIEFEIAGVLAGGRELPTARVAAKDFASLSWVPAAWGLEANVEPGHGSKDRVRHAIQCLAQDVVKETVFEHTGWRTIGGKWLYLHAGGAVGANGPVSGVTVDPGEKLKDYVLPEPPEGADLTAAVQASLALLNVAPARITYPLLAAVYRAPLAEALAVDLSLYLAGPTGAKKTSLTALAQAHWGAKFNDRNLPGSWDSTANALEKLAFLAKDAVLVVDDFAPKGSTSDIQRLHREADRLLRAQGNLAGRGRMRADGSLRPDYVPRGLIVSSGEDIPRGQSLRARALILEAGPDDVDLERLTEVQRAARNGLLAAALAGYVRWLAARMDDLKAGLRERHEALRAEARKMNFTHDRTPDIVANLALGWEQFLRFAVEAGAVTQDEAAELERACKDALLAAGEAQAEHLASEEPTGRFLALVAAALTSGKAHIADARTGQEPDAAAAWGWRESQPLGSLIGWLDGDDLLLDPEAAYAAAQKLARDQNASLPITQRVLWKRLAERGLILAEKSGGRVYYTAKRTVVNCRRRVLVLPQNLASLITHNVGNVGIVGEPLRDKGLRAQKVPTFSETLQKCGQKMWAEDSSRDGGTDECPQKVPTLFEQNEKCGQENGPESLENQGPAHIAHKAHKMQHKRQETLEPPDPAAEGGEYVDADFDDIPL